MTIDEVIRNSEAGKYNEEADDKADMERFHNRLRVLCNIDIWDVDMSRWDTNREGLFFDNPWKFFIQCSDKQRAELWRIIREREGS